MTKNTVMNKLRFLCGKEINIGNNKGIITPFAFEQDGVKKNNDIWSRIFHPHSQAIKKEIRSNNPKITSSWLSIRIMQSTNWEDHRVKRYHHSRAINNINNNINNKI
ncbi:hypothetical protein ALC53_06693 [Atta colombica]|uniref:Uncharacterized protein n=1 Tax=Atta colombica TaxID=520822 RepID=A0A151I3E3_9HYME|nr:hypothetical protein ALC53_06693 [Atta colombica]